MAPPILPSFNVPPVPADATAVAPPNLGGGEQPEPTYYEKLRAIYNDAVRLSHLKGRNGQRKYTAKEIDGWVRQVASETFQGAHNFRTFGHLANTLQNLDSKGQRPITEDDLSPAEKGAFARTVLFGHSALPFTDEIAGALSFLTPGGQGYRAGRDEQRRYLDRARQFSSNPGLLNPEVWGPPAAILATGGAGGGPAPGLLKSGAIGAGYGLGYGLADMPELTPEALQENAVPLTAQTAFGGMFGMTPALITKRAAAAFRPGAVKMEKALTAAGGEEGLAAAVRRSGSPTPMLSELQSTTFSRLGTELRRSSAEATAEALDRVHVQLQAAVKAKQVAGQPWDALQTQISNARAAEILGRRPIKRLIARMVSEEALAPGSPITGRVLEDIRQEILYEAKGVARRRPGTAKRYRGWAKELERIIDAGGEGMETARRAYGPLAERVSRLSDMERRLSMAARTSGIPTERKVTAHSEALQELGIEPWQRQMTGARQMAGPLYTPGTAAEHAARIHGMQPWYNQFNRLGGPTAGMMAPRVINPFFQMEPQEP